MEKEKNNLTSFEVKEEGVKNMSPRQINNTPFNAVPNDKGEWYITLGKFVMIERPFSSYKAAVQGFAKNKWDIIINVASLCAGIQIQNALSQKAPNGGDPFEENEGK